MTFTKSIVKSIYLFDKITCDNHMFVFVLSGKYPLSAVGSQIYFKAKFCNYYINARLKYAVLVRC